MPTSLDDSWLARFVGAVVESPRPIIFSLLIVVALAALGAARTSLDFSSKSFYGDDGDRAAELAEFHERWGVDDGTVAVLVESTDGSVMTHARMASIAALSERLAAVPGVVRVDSVATAILPFAFPGDGTRGRTPLFQVVPRDAAAAREFETLVLERAPFVPVLLAPDGRSTIVAVELSTSSDDLAAIVPIVEGLEAGIGAWEGATGGAPTLRVSLAGVPAIRAAFFRLTMRDQLVLVPLTLLLIGGAFWRVFRSPRSVLVPAIAAGLPMLGLLGVMGWVGESIGLINQAYFTLIPVLAVADAVHLYSRFEEERRAGVEPRQAAVRSMARAGLGCLLATATTILGFASLGLAELPVVRHFGAYGALGMLFSFVGLCTAVALFLSQTRGAPPKGDGRGPRLEAACRRVIAHPGRVLLAFGGLLLVSIWGAGQVQIDNRLTDLLKPSHEVRRANDRVDQAHGGSLSLEVELSGAPGSLTDPQVLAAVTELEEWAVAQTEVGTALGPGLLQRTIAASGETAPQTADDIRAALGHLEGVFDVSRVLSDDASHARVSLRVPETGGRAFERLAGEVRARFRGALAPLGVQTRVTGTTLLAYSGVNGIAADLRTSLALVFAVVSLVIALLFRSLRIAALALLPNGLPLLVGYAAVGWTGATLDPLAAVILTLGIAIAVDDTIHILVRVREEASRGHAAEEAVVRAVGRSGRAVVVTTLILSGGLAVNLLSSFPPLQMLGALGATVMLVALVCDLVLLPVLLLKLGGRGVVG